MDVVSIFVTKALDNLCDNYNNKYNGYENVPYTGGSPGTWPKLLAICGVAELAQSSGARPCLVPKLRLGTAGVEAPASRAGRPGAVSRRSSQGHRSGRVAVWHQFEAGASNGCVPKQSLGTRCRCTLATVVPQVERQWRITASAATTKRWCPARRGPAVGFPRGVVQNQASAGTSPTVGKSSRGAKKKGQGIEQKLTEETESATMLYKVAQKGPVMRNTRFCAGVRHIRAGRKSFQRFSKACGRRGGVRRITLVLRLKCRPAQWKRQLLGARGEAHLKSCAYAQ